jgi:hypothetical protein
LAAGLWAAFAEARERRDFALGYVLKYQHFCLNLVSINPLTMGYGRVQMVFFILTLRLGDNLPTAPTTTTTTTLLIAILLTSALAAVSE